MRASIAIPFLAAAVATALASPPAAARPKDKAPAAAARSGGRTSAPQPLITNSFLGCKKSSTFLSVRAVAAQRDVGSLTRFLSDSLARGECEILKPGPVAIDDAALAGELCVRPASATTCLWFPSFLVSIPAKPADGDKRPDPNGATDQLFMDTTLGKIPVRDIHKRDTDRALAMGISSAEFDTAACFDQADGDVQKAAACILAALSRGTGAKAEIFANCPARTLISEDSLSYSIASTAGTGPARLLGWRYGADGALIDPSAPLSMRLAQQYALLCPYTLDDAERKTDKTSGIKAAPPVAGPQKHGP